MSSEPTESTWSFSASSNLLGNYFLDKKKISNNAYSNSQEGQFYYTLKHNKAVAYALFCTVSFCLVTFAKDLNIFLQIL